MLFLFEAALLKYHDLIVFNNGSDAMMINVEIKVIFPYLAVTCFRNILYEGDLISLKRGISIWGIEMFIVKVHHLRVPNGDNGCEESWSWIQPLRIVINGCEIEVP